MTTRSWIHSAPGLRALLECKVSADPPSTVTWLKSEMPVSLDNRVVSLVDGDKHSLLIRNVQRSDFGIYTCRAINDLGQGDMQIQLSGKIPQKRFKGVIKRKRDCDRLAKKCSVHVVHRERERSRVSTNPISLDALTSNSIQQASQILAYSKKPTTKTSTRRTFTRSFGRWTATHR